MKEEKKTSVCTNQLCMFAGKATEPVNSIHF